VEEDKLITVAKSPIPEFVVYEKSELANTEDKNIN
jgi:hypothetical protein